MRCTQRTQGHTLLEVLAVVGLTLVLAGGGVPSLVTLLHGARLAAATRTLAVSLRLARGRALAGEGTIDVVLDAASRAFAVRNAAGVVLERQSLPAGTTFAALPARGRIRFGPLGTADNATVTLGAGSRTRQVVVNQRGRVRLP